MKSRTAALLLLLAGGALLPGCYFVHHAIPTDASGMEFPARWAGNALEDQCSRSGALITGLPSSFAAHVRTCWRHLTLDQSEDW